MKPLDGNRTVPADLRLPHEKTHFKCSLLRGLAAPLL